MSTFHVVRFSFLNDQLLHFLDQVWASTIGLHFFLSLPQFLLRFKYIPLYQHLHNSLWTPVAKVVLPFLPFPCHRVYFQFQAFKASSFSSIWAISLFLVVFFCPFHRNRKIVLNCTASGNPVCWHTETTITWIHWAWPGRRGTTDLRRQAAVWYVLLG